MDYIQAVKSLFASLPSPLVVNSLRYVCSRPLPKNAFDNQMLINEAWEIGAEQFVSRIKKSTQAALLSDLIEEECKKSSIADRLEQELKKDLTGPTPGATFKLVNAKLIKACATELTIDATQDLAQLKSQLVDEVIYMGMETLFSLLPRSVLVQYCDHWKLGKEGGKGSLVSRVLMHLFDLDLADQVGNDGGDEEEADEQQQKEAMEVEEAATTNSKKRKAAAAVAKNEEAKTTATIKKAAAADKKKRAKGDEEEEAMGSSQSSSEEEDDAEEEEWERNKKNHRAAKQADAKTNNKKGAESKAASKPQPASKKAATAPSPRPKKKVLQLPADMKDLTMDMKESNIMRKYKIDQIKRCLKMNGLDDVGLKAKLVSRLHTYMMQCDGDEENVDPNHNCME